MRGDEKKVEAACDRLMASLGYTAIRFSQARATMQTPGIPDRKYYREKHTFWFEAKAATKQSYHQKCFEHLARQAGEDYVLGGVPELVEYLDKLGICRELPSGAILIAGAQSVGLLPLPSTERLVSPNPPRARAGGPTSLIGE